MEASLFQETYPVLKNSWLRSCNKNMEVRLHKQNEDRKEIRKNERTLSTWVGDIILE